MKYFALVLAVLAVFLLSCEKPSSDSKSDRVKIATTILPLADFIKKIGGDKVTVEVMVAPGRSPEEYEPTPDQLRSISTADLYVKIGGPFPFEQIWIDKISADENGIKMIDCSNGITFINNDPHIWLGIDEVKTICKNIVSGIIEFDSSNAPYYMNNYSMFIGKLDSAAGAIETNINRIKNREFLVYHPAWVYFAHKFGLKEISIEKEGRTPKARELAKVIDLAKAKKIKSIFVEPQFDTTSASAIANELGASLVYINPLPDDYLENLRDISDKFIQHLDKNESGN